MIDEQKVRFIRGLLIRKGIRAIWLRKLANFTWLSNGRGWISTDSERAEASFLVTGNSVYLVANNIEKNRLLKEEIGEEMKTLVYKWYDKPETVVNDVIPLEDIGTDDGSYGKDVDGELREIRMVMTQKDIDAYKSEGSELMRVFEEAVSSLKPRMTEYEAAGVISYHLIKNQFIVPVLLVFSDQSRLEYRHNLCRNLPLGDRFFASICARKKGPIQSMTRTCEFVDDKDFEKQHEVNTKVDAKLINATVPGRALSDVFNALNSFYSEAGYKGEIEKHHQGGPIGFMTREETMTPTNKLKIRNNMAFCWNPTITGTKSEDTFVLINTIPFLTTCNESTTWPYKVYEIGGKKILRPQVKKLNV
jgi:Xaa-Pro dipeptidase